MQDLGLPVDKELILHSDWGNAKIIEAAAQQLLSIKPRPSAVLCVSDAAAMITMRVAWQMGFSLPQQLSVIGYSNSSLAAYAYPALTTVAQPFKEMGHIAAQRLLAHIAAQKNGHACAATYDAPPQKLIVRASTAPPQTVPGPE
jgi:LacI family transcriptional regulator